MPRLITRLPDGPVDILGDIHGEIEALDRILEKLGVDVAAGKASRPLVFVGDLVDRGPDSVAVVQRVADLVEAGLATVVLGNHELNLLQGDQKQGNGWFWEGLGPDGQPDRFTLQHGGVGEHHPFHSRLASEAERRFILDFFKTLPLVAENEDLRVVHAAPDPLALASLPEHGDVVDLAAAADAHIRESLDARGVRAAARTERAAWSQLRDFNHKPTTLLENVATEAAEEQAGNPISILTSGLERRIPLDQIFHAGGKWRFVARHPWWESYGLDPDGASPPPFVVVGHYWRRRDARDIHDKADVWKAPQHLGWAGPLGRAFCVDFSVGRRFAERARGLGGNFAGGLAALRWPECRLVFDDWEAPVDTHRPAPDAGRSE